MAELYLCGKDTGLIPLFNASGTQIDCISLLACSGSNRKLGQGGCVEVSSSGRSSAAPMSRIPVFKATRPSSIYTSKFSTKDVSAGSQRAPGRAAPDAASSQGDGINVSDRDDSEQSDTTKAGIFGLPTYAVFGGAAVIGIAAFFLLTSKEKKA